MSSHPPRILAAIDCGSNSFHLVVVRVDAASGTWETLAKDKEMVRLQAGKVEGALTKDAMERGLDALKRFRRLAEGQGVDTMVAVATSAVRDATNGVEFLDRCRDEAGVEVELIGGAEEARLVYLGARSALAMGRDRVAIVDIGGGSTEIAIGTATELMLARSLKLGAVRLYEQYVDEDPVTSESYFRLVAHVKGALHQLVPQLRDVGYDRLVATSGTALTLGEIDAAMGGRTPPKSMHGYVLTRERLRAIELQVRALPLKERQKLAGLPPRRADIIVAGAGILATVMDELDVRELTLCDRSLREGVVVDVLDRMGMTPLSVGADVRSRALRAAGSRFHYDRDHAEHVTTLALKIFDQTASLHGLDRDARHILEGAALLHDVGFHISHTSHHKHSYYLIRHAELVGFHEPEIELMANVARYHRKSLPKDKHMNFKALSPTQRDVAGKLIAILRVADGLDHACTQSVRDVSVLLEPQETVFFLQAQGEIDIDTWGASDKADAWARYMGRRVRFVPVPALTGTGGTGPLALPL